MPKSDKPPDVLLMGPIERTERLIYLKGKVALFFLTRMFIPEIAEKNQKEINILKRKVEGFNLKETKKEIELKIREEKNSLEVLKKNNDLAYVQQIIKEKESYISGLESNIYHKHYRRFS